MQQSAAKPSAYFKVTDVFTVTGRGIVIAGNIIDGEINIGDRVELNVQGAVIKLIILSVESISSTNVGLMVGHLGDYVLEKVKLFQRQVVVILGDK